jgi:hypothetical protein
MIDIEAYPRPGNQEMSLKNSITVVIGGLSRVAPAERPSRGKAMDNAEQAAVAPSSTAPVPGDRGAALFVWGIWAVMSLGVLVYIRSFACNVPFDDEWGMVAAVTHHQPVTLNYLWSLNNEHRIFLPRLLYLGLARVTGGDFRAGMYFIAAALAALSAGMIWAALRLRGWTSFADAFFPLALLHFGHCENLLWSFQVVFMASTLLIFGMLFLILQSRQPLTWRPALVGGLCLIGLPLCGANGIPLVPPLALWLAYWALRHRRATGPGGVRTIALVGGLIGAAFLLVLYYCQDLSRAGPPSPGWRATAKVAAEFLAVSLGVGIAPWWPYIGYAVAAVLTLSAAMLLVRWWQEPAERVRCTGLLLFLMGLAGLAVAIGWGRAGFGPTQGFSYRYSMLAAPVLCSVFLTAEIAAPAALARVLQVALFTCLSVVLVPNTQAGLFFGNYKYNQIKPVERELGPSFSAEQFAHKYGFMCRDVFRFHDDDTASGRFVQKYLSTGPNPDFMESRLEMLRRAGIGRFKRLSPPSSP